jgi:hypothetical protein
MAEIVQLELSYALPLLSTRLLATDERRYLDDRLLGATCDRQRDLGPASGPHEGIGLSSYRASR